MPTANAEGPIKSEGGVGKVSVRRVFRYRQIGTGPRRLGMLRDSKKKIVMGEAVKSPSSHTPVMVAPKGTIGAGMCLPSRVKKKR